MLQQERFAVGFAPSRIIIATFALPLLQLYREIQANHLLDRNVSGAPGRSLQMLLLQACDAPLTPTAPLRRWLQQAFTC